MNTVTVITPAPLVWDSYTFTVGEHFLSALINCDASGLEGDEAALLQEFKAQECLADKAGHWSYDPNDQPRFARCEITGLHSTCESIQFMCVVNPETTR